MKKRSTLIIIIAVLIVAVGVYYWVGNGAKTQTPTSEVPSLPTGGTEMATSTVSGAGAPTLPVPPLP